MNGKSRPLGVLVGSRGDSKFWLLQPISGFLDFWISACIFHQVVLLAAMFRMPAKCKGTVSVRVCIFDEPRCVVEQTEREVRLCLTNDKIGEII